VSEVKSTPYSEMETSFLLSAMESTDEYIKVHSKQLAWAEENDHDSGIIDALRSDLDHAVADFGWMRQEMWNRGYKHNTLTDTWEKE
jgi:hypothetical protein